MKTYLVAYYYPDDSSTLFSGTLIFLAVFVLGFSLWKAIEWLRNRAALHRRKATSQPESTKGSWDQAISRPAADHNYASFMGEGSELGGLAGMSRREQEYLFATYGPRKVRKEMKQRLRARQQKDRERGS